MNESLEMMGAPGLVTVEKHTYNKYNVQNRACPLGRKSYQILETHTIHAHIQVNTVFYYVQTICTSQCACTGVKCAFYTHSRV